MWRNRTFGAVVLALGAGLLNLIYLWDILLSKHEGTIILGTRASLGIVFANIVIIAGLVMMTIRKSPSPEGGETTATPHDKIRPF